MRTLFLASLALSYPAFAAPPAEPLEIGQRQKVRDERDWFHFVTYGKATLRVTVEGGKAEGLFRARGGKVTTVQKPGQIEVKVGEAGLVRLNYKPGVEEKSVVITSACEGECFRPNLPIARLLRELSRDGHQRLTDFLEGRLKERLEKADSVNRLLKEWEKVPLPPRFPTLPPVDKLVEYRSLLGLVPTSTRPEVKPRTEALAKLLEEPEVGESLKPPPVHEKLPAVGYGHFRNPALPISVVKHSLATAQLLNGLAAHDWRVETPKPIVGLRSPEEFFRWLLANGHTIEMRDERVYANFLSFTYGEKNVLWPVWIDTGVTLSDKSSLTIPVGHSQYAWRIRGPVVNARVVFFLGTNGVGFFPQIDERPRWTGGRVAEVVESGTEAGDRSILATVAAATKYQRQIRKEAKTVAKDLPVDGYGFVGVCTDSTATIQAWTKRPVSTYPLARSADLEKLAKMPTDVTADPQALGRILAMNPLPFDSKEQPDEEVQRQWNRAREDWARK